MNFEFSDEQQMLRDQARSYLTQRCPTTLVRRVLNNRETHDADLHNGIAEMGWTATTIPEEYGGLGMSHLELVVIAEELGRACAPVPFSSTMYLAAEAIMAHGSEAQKQAWLPKFADGSAIGCFAMGEAGGRMTADQLTTTISDGVINGTKLPVADGGIAHVAIVVCKADSGDGATLALVDLSQDAVERDKVQTIDFSRGHASLGFNGACAEVLGEEGAGWSAVEALMNRAAVMFAWEQLGIADTALDQAREYALGRFAFGRSIASYQAIKHKLAKMYVKNTLARSNAYYGAWALNADSKDLGVAAATARVSAIQASLFAAEENIQTHGGMGFTWEFDCQFYYRRAKLLSLAIGSENQWQGRLVDGLAASA